MNTRFKETGKKFGIWILIAAIFFISFPFRLQAAEEEPSAEAVTLVEETADETGAEAVTLAEETADEIGADEIMLTEDPTDPADPTDPTEPTDPEDPPQEDPHEKDGAYLEDGVLRYYEGGVRKTATGLVTRISDNQLVYVKNGVFAKVTGVVKRISNGKLMFVKEGLFTASTGVAKNLISGKWVYVKAGVFTKATGIAKRGTDQKYVYVSKGVFKKATGAAKKISSGKTYYVKNGIYNKHTGLVKKISDGKWIFVRRGQQTKKLSQIVLTKADEKAGLKKHFVEVYAKALADKLTNKSMTEAQKIKAVFQYVVTHFRSTGNPRIPHYLGTDWPYVYAYDMYGPRGGGNCMSYASSFAFLAKAAGCKEVICCNSGGHAWVEVNGRVYDPEQYHDTARKIYNYAYSHPTIKHYWGTISDYKSKPFKRVTIKAF